jgi:GNAT superfamily N-acetyltransferase
MDKFEKLMDEFEKLIDEFEKLIDDYLINYSKFDNGKNSFECKYGELIFYKNKYNPIALTVFGIYIYPEYRRLGLCRHILHYLIDKCPLYNIKYLYVESVLSRILYDYLLRFKYKNKKFTKLIDGFSYKI